MKTLQQLLAVDNCDVHLVLGILIGFGLMESFARYLPNSKRKKGSFWNDTHLNPSTCQRKRLL